MRSLRALTALALPFALAAPALAQETARESLSLAVVGSTVLYGVIGLLITLAGYFIFDKVVGLDLKRELVEDQNTALGIMLAGVFIGCSIVVAAVMLS
jgi:uncharacterized membrane protein YjfL (UPF0719 family)